MKISIAIAAVVFATGSAVSYAAPVTLYSTDFESFTTGSSLVSNGFSQDGGSGTSATVVAPGAAFVHSGTKAAQFVPATTGIYDYKLMTPAVTDFSTNNVIQASVSLNIANAAAGTASRGVETGLQIYDTNVNEIADMLLVWDPQNNIVGAGANHYYLFYDSFFNPAAETAQTSDGGGFDLGVVTAAQLNSVGYFNLSIQVDYTNNTVRFFESGDLIDQTAIEPGAYTDFSDADIFFERGSGGTTSPRIFGDDYSVIQTVPEPTSIAMIGLFGTRAFGRRRRA